MGGGARPPARSNPPPSACTAMPHPRVGARHQAGSPAGRQRAAAERRRQRGARGGLAGASDGGGLHGGG